MFIKPLCRDNDTPYGGFLVSVVEGFLWHLAEFV